ncbi:hypothetical protein FOZ63_028737, partial [Perkinsus olseni]
LEQEKHEAQTAKSQLAELMEASLSQAAKLETAKQLSRAFRCVANSVRRGSQARFCLVVLRSWRKYVAVLLKFANLRNVELHPSGQPADDYDAECVRRVEAAVVPSPRASRPSSVLQSMETPAPVARILAASRAANAKAQGSLLPCLVDARTSGVTGVV